MKVIYTWSGISPNGQKIHGEIEAKNFIYAKTALRHQGINVTKLRKKLFFTQKKITNLDITLFLRQLSTLISAGIPIIQSCSTLLQVQNNPALNKIILTIKNEIEAGKNLSQTLLKFPHYFDAFTYHLVQLGEHTGKLDQSLLRAAEYKDKTINLHKQLKQALFYPTIITSTAVLVTIIMLIFIVPRFAELFQNMHHQLPFFTRCVLGISNLLRHYYWLACLPIILIALLVHYYRHSQSIQIKIDNLSLKFPLFGNILHKSILSRFIRSLAMTFSAGIPLLSALNIITDMTKHTTYVHAIHRIKQEVTRGQQLHAAMQMNPLFPGLIVQMIKIGEESGMLESMLEKIADIYESDIDQFIVYLKHMLEPLIMVILGVLIGGLVVAMYLPIFKLGTVI